MKRYFFALMICLFVLIAGCSQETGTQTGTTEPFIGGSQGIVAEFEQAGVVENGVDTIYDNENFPIQVVLRNKGEESISAGDATVILKGMLLSDFSGLVSGTLKNKAEIEKVSRTNENGGEEIVDFTLSDGAHYLQKIPGTQYSVNIFAEYTYAYKTQASVPKVCFKEDIRDPRICTVEGKKDSYSSGAPIQVKSVEEKSAGRGIVELDFEVENVGGGQSTKPGERFDSRYDQISYLLYPDTERSKWKCTSAGKENEAKLQKGKATIICRLINALEKDALYEKEIGLELSYDYRDIVQKTVNIKKSE